MRGGKVTGKTFFARGVGWTALKRAAAVSLVQAQRNTPNNNGAPADQAAASDRMCSAGGAEQLFQEFLTWRQFRSR